MIVVLKFIQVYAVIGVILVGCFYTRRREYVTTGELLAISMFWPIASLFACFFVAGGAK